MFSVCKCVRYQASPRESHLKATKIILRYLKGTHDVGLWYPKGSNFELIGYSDSDYGGCKIDRMSTSDTCQLLGKSLRNKIVLYYQPPMPNTLVSVVVVHNCFG